MILQRIKTTERTETVQKSLTSKTNPKEFKKLGNGVFGKVVEHPNPNLVIKIGKGVGGADRDGWLLWAQASNMFPNPFVPRIVSITVWENQYHNESVYLAVMEKLHPFDPFRTDEEKLAGLIHPTWKTIQSLEIESRRVRLCADKATKEQRNLYRAYQWCLEKPFHMSKDLHQNNWMLRRTKNGDIPVITDPFAW